jgi:hypothetical protein
MTDDHREAGTVYSRFSMRFNLSANGVKQFLSLGSSVI